jgi:hypothetical protein
MGRKIMFSLEKESPFSWAEKGRNEKKFLNQESEE